MIKFYKTDDGTIYGIDNSAPTLTMYKWEDGMVKPLEPTGYDLVEFFWANEVREEELVRLGLLTDAEDGTHPAK